MTPADQRCADPLAGVGRWFAVGGQGLGFSCTLKQ